MIFKKALLNFLFILFLSYLNTQYSTLNSQIIDNRLGNAFEDEMFFNQEFLWQNKIKTITGTVSIKRTGRPIDQRPDISVFRINEVGLLNQIDKVTSVLHLMDSSSILFRRNDLGEVELRSEKGTKGYSTTQFNYDDEGHLVRIDYGKAENISAEKSKLEPGQSIIINSETFVWNEAGEGTLRRSNFNNYGLHYSNTTTTINELQYVTREVEELLMSGRTTTHTYTYNERGWISKIEATDNLHPITNGSPHSSKTFYYDDIGNLLKVEYREGEKVLREVEVLYTGTMLIEAFLDLDAGTNDITITKFTYEFYTL
ncbi:MAG: hypothetical protein SH856_13200 [Flavobacteriales bacterium]|nr:hypothetical protein [Flavobacteriales bacterium]